MPYMSGVGPLTWRTIQESNEMIAIPAMEFWSTLCDEEIFLNEIAEDAAASGQQPERRNQRFVAQALQYLIPLLTEQLCKRDNEDDEDAWNLSMAAGTCLGLVAQATKDECVDPVLAFVGQSFGNNDWKVKEAAVLAYGSIMEGPSSARLAPLVSQSFPQLVLGLQDASVCVRDTTAWTIGRIAQFHVSVLAPHLQELMQVLSLSFQDKPRVAAQVCWVIDSLAEQMPGSAGEHAPSTALSPFFMPLVTLLLQCGARQDADEKNLRAAAYNALSNLISKAGHDCRPHMDVVLKELCDRLDASFQMAPSNELLEVQGSLIGCLQVLTSRMEAGVLPHAERLWGMYYKMFQLYQTSQGHPCVHEEAVLATGALCTALGKQFAPFMQHFMPVLKVGLGRFEEETVCGICVATLGDVARATEKAIVPYCEDILTVLYTLVNDASVNRKLTPPIIQCFGDIALAAEGDYERFLGPVVTVLQQASAAQCEAGASAEWMDYISQLQESVLEAYTGIIHGLKAENKLDSFKGHVNAVLDFVQRIVTAQEKPQSSVVKSAVCVMGDLVLAFKAELAAYLGSAPFMGQLVQLARSCDDPKVLQDAQWLENVLMKFRTG